MCVCVCVCSFSLIANDFKPHESVICLYLFACYLAWCFKYCGFVVLKCVLSDTVLNAEILGAALEGVKRIKRTLSNLATIMKHLLLLFNRIP